jgi:hypothetical protein
MISLTAEGHTVKLRNLWLTLFISSLYLSQIKKKTLDLLTPASQSSSPATGAVSGAAPHNGAVRGSVASATRQSPRVAWRSSSAYATDRRRRFPAPHR